MPKVHQALLKELARQQAKLEALIAAKVENTQRFAQRAEIIQSVPGLAETAASGIIAFLPELSRSIARRPPPYSARSIRR